MALTTGNRIGPYEIVEAIGAGGMGEVYRARDAKLARDVAIKVLPAELALDADRLARFTREAQVLASLNHQNIAGIYGFEEGPADAGHYVHALVLEFVDGPTLADRIAQGAIPIDEALPIARQIAEALEAAHEQGIVHRDLKPANIKVRPDGTVKVLDFGLAKLTTSVAPAGSKDPAYTVSPTITTPAMTQVGMILGTAAYMSPEQAKGREADRRSDIWAFGCVLYEMLTGKRAFEGDDVSDTLAAVLRADPEWSALPADTSPRIRGLLQRCLRKDAQKRLPHIAAIRFELEEAPADSIAFVTSPPAARPSVVRRAVAVAIGMVVAAAITSAAWWMFSSRPSAPLVTRFELPLAIGEQAGAYPFRNIAISSDGTQIAYVTNGLLHVRPLSESTATVISTPDVGIIGTPVFSPDDQSIAYVSGARNGPGGGGGATLKTISIRGGVPTTIAQMSAGTVLGVSWSRDGIVYADMVAGVFRVPPDAKQSEMLVQPGNGEAIEGPSLLPGGHAVLFSVGKNRLAGIAPTLDMWDEARIFVRTLPAGERRLLIEGGSNPVYVPTGHLLFVRGGTVFAVPFDLKRLEVNGRPTPVLDGVGRVVSGRASTGAAQLSVSSNGSLVYAAGPSSPSLARPNLVMVDRAGNVTELKAAPGFYERPRVSPDGSRVALSSDDDSGAQVWIYDLSGKTSIRQLTFEGKNRFPIWSANGTHVAFQSDREGDAGIFSQRSDGGSPAERLTKPEKDTVHLPESWSPDGKHLLYSVAAGALNALWVYSADTKKSTPFGDVRSPRLISSTFSPDGRWVAYTLTTNGLNQVFVQPFPQTGVKYLVGSGARPQWSPDGKEIFLYRNEGTFVKTVTTQPSFSLSNETKLPFNVYVGRGPGSGRDADIMPDGKRFVAVVSSTDQNAGPSGIREFHVVLNWFQELNHKVPR